MLARPVANKLSADSLEKIQEFGLLLFGDPAVSRYSFNGLSNLGRWPFGNNARVLEPFGKECHLGGCDFPVRDYASTYPDKFLNATSARKNCWVLGGSGIGGGHFAQRRNS